MSCKTFTNLLAVHYNRKLALAVDTIGVVFILTKLSLGLPVSWMALIGGLLLIDLVIAGWWIVSTAIDDVNIALFSIQDRDCPPGHTNCDDCEYDEGYYCNYRKGNK
jgi:hypothetical protein